MMKTRLIATLAVTAMIAACSPPAAEAPTTGAAAEAPAATSAATTDAGPFKVSAASVRAPAGGRDVTAGFLVIENPGTSADRLVSASSPMASSIELHTHTSEGGMMRMRQVDGFDLPAGGRLALESGGDHLMLFGVKPELATAASIPVTLTFQTAGAVEVTLPVVQGDAGAADGDHGHGGHGSGEKK